MSSFSTSVRIIAGAAAVLIGILAPFLSAQNAPREPRFAIEMSNTDGPPHFIPVPEGPGESTAWFPVRTQKEARQPERSEPSVLQLRCKVADDSVVISAALLFGAFDENDMPGSLKGLPEKTLGNYFARMGESFVIHEMEQFGLKPLTLKIVSAQGPPGPLPLATTKVPSLQLKVIGEDRMGYKLSLLNVSTRPVVAYQIHTRAANGGTGQESSDYGALIAPGANREIQFPKTISGHMTPSGYVTDPPSNEVVTVTAALFADGTHEGDKGAAAKLDASRVARKFQRERINSVVSGILADTTSDDAARIARIRAEVPKHPVDTAGNHRRNSGPFRRAFRPRLEGGQRSGESCHGKREGIGVAQLAGIREKPPEWYLPY